MANMVYADPFSSYVRGSQAGTENAIQTAEAARRIKGADINLDFMKWYVPHRQQEALAQLAQEKAKAGEAELGLNRGVLGNAADLSNFGEQGQNYLRQTLANIYGFDPNKIQAASGLDFQRQAYAGAGSVPAGLYDPMFANVGHYGYQKLEAHPPTTVQPGQEEPTLYTRPWKVPPTAAPAPQQINPMYTPNMGTAVAPQQHDFHSLNPDWSTGLTKGEVQRTAQQFGGGSGGVQP